MIFTKETLDSWFTERIYEDESEKNAKLQAEAEDRDRSLTEVEQ